MYKALIFDLDGTVYLESRPFNGAVEFINRIIKKYEIFFVTNNTSVSRTYYYKKLINMGINVLDIEHIITPIKSMSVYFLKNNIKTIYPLVTNMVKEEIVSLGLTISENPDEIDAVVTAFDKELNYNKLLVASNAILQKVPYYSTHPDITCPTPSGQIPDVGCINVFLQAATGKQPLRYFGKPSVELIEPILSKFDLDEILVVGDRVYTDFKLAKNCNVDFALVLSGETKTAPVDDMPRYVFDNILGLSNILEN